MPQPERCETRGRPMLAAVNPTDRIAILFRPRCKSWACPYCAEVNKRLWTIKAHAGTEALITEGIEMKFVTLTSHERLEARQTWYVWGSAWKKLSTRLVREQGKGHQYLMVPEQHEDGRLHMHAIATWTVSQNWLKDNARESGLGYIQEIKPLQNPEKGAWYVSKYLGKQLSILDWPKGWRHVRTSQGWPKLDHQEPDKWFFDTLGRESAEGRKGRYEERGFTVLTMSHDIAWGVMDAIDSLTEPD